MKLSGAEITIRLLKMHGIETIAGIPGGSNLPLYNALCKSGIRHILPRHEQGAGFISQGMSRASGKTAVCFATSGPGATNLITAIADAKLDSIPMIAITGQVPTAYLGTDAFQEVDIYQMTIPITKHNFLARTASELLKIIPAAFKIANTGRPGPVLIDIPKDVQNQIIEFPDDFTISSISETQEIDEMLIRQAADMINASARPVIYAGGGINTHERAALLLELSKKGSIPVTLTLMGLGAYPADDDLYLGMIGMHGTPYANDAIDKSDLIIALGVRFDDRAIGKADQFSPDAKIIHVDIDHIELDKIRQTTVAIQADTFDFLKKIIPLINTSNRPEWTDHLNGVKKSVNYPSHDQSDMMNAVNILKMINNAAHKDAIITTDVGQHQMWTAMVYKFNQPRTFLTSGGLGTMGFGLPAAIGAALECPGRQVICITGDGSIQMNIQEFATLAELGLPVKIFVLNNDRLGLVRQQQELFYNGNYIASKYPGTINFAAIAAAYGIESYIINADNIGTCDFNDKIKSAAPVLFDIRITKDDNVLPMVPPGAANKDMLGVIIYD